MAEVSDLRTDVAMQRALRLNRKTARGLYTNPVTGASSRYRRAVINGTTAVGVTPAIHRERLRKGWSLTAAFTATQP